MGCGKIRPMRTLLVVLLALFQARSAEDISIPLESITQRDLRAHLTFLASDALEGRESTTRGGEIAARYIAAEFAKYGLQPIGDNAGYFQVIPLLLYVPDNEKSF